MWLSTGRVSWLTLVGAVPIAHRCHDVEQLIKQVLTLQAEKDFGKGRAKCRNREGMINPPVFREVGFLMCRLGDERLEVVANDFGLEIMDDGFLR